MSTFYGELREAIHEIQHVLNTEDEPFPRSKANVLCDALLEMIGEYQHEPDTFEGWASWRQLAYAELGELDTMPSRNHIKVSRARHE